VSVDLQRRLLGSTGLVVHPICLGCASLGDMPDTFAYSVPEGSALATVRAFFASELNFIDTANVYGFGESERRIGVVLREMGALPAGFVLSTKLDRERGTNRFDGARARASIEESRRRLGLDRLQLVYLHDFEYCDQDEILGPGGALEVLRQYQADGIVEHIGLAAGPIPEMIRYLDHAPFEAVITHNRYTLLNREAEPLIAECQRRGIALVNAAPYGSGMLAKGPSAYPRYMYKDAPAELVERALKLEAVCQRWNVPLAAAALQFSLRDPRVAATIVGMTKPERIEQTLALTRVDVPEAIWFELDQAAGFA
jgi:D-threo-aldose 1-dehydrogenase